MKWADKIRNIKVDLATIKEEIDNNNIDREYIIKILNDSIDSLSNLNYEFGILKENIYLELEDF